jgi:hypothetical protein
VFNKPLKGDDCAIAGTLYERVCPLGLTHNGKCQHIIPGLLAPPVLVPNHPVVYVAPESPSPTHPLQGDPDAFPILKPRLLWTSPQEEL